MMSDKPQTKDWRRVKEEIKVQFLESSALLSNSVSISRKNTNRDGKTAGEKRGGGAEGG